MLVRADQGERRYVAGTQNTYESAQLKADSQGASFLADGGFGAIQLPGDSCGGFAASVSAEGLEVGGGPEIDGSLLAGAWHAGLRCRCIECVERFRRESIVGCSGCLRSDVPPSSR